MIINKKEGFTLVEMLIVISISSFLTISLLNTALRTRLNLKEVAQVMISDIRTAQANSLASKQYVDPITSIPSHRCGYGIHRLDSTTYYIYTGRVPSSGSCPADTKFGTSQDTPIFLARVIDVRLELYSPTTGPDPRFEDVYFNSYDGKVYINNQHQPGNKNNNKAQIIIRKVGAACPSSSCTYICVYASGKVESRATACTDF